MTEAELMMPMRTGEIRIHDEAGFEGMRKAGRLVAECLDTLVGEVKPGVTTAYIDDLIREFVYDHGADSATIGWLTNKEDATAIEHSPKKRRPGLAWSNL